MSRPDLGSDFDGWQVCDPTPQETSDGKLLVIHSVSENQYKIRSNGLYVYDLVNSRFVKTHAKNKKKQFYAAHHWINLHVAMLEAQSRKILHFANNFCGKRRLVLSKKKVICVFGV